MADYQEPTTTQAPKEHQPTPRSAPSAQRGPQRTSNPCIQLVGKSFVQQEATLKPPEPGYNEQVQALKPSDSAAQMMANTTKKTAADVHAVAAQGVSGGGGALPHIDTIQASFGHHDVTSVQAFTGPQASKAAKSLGADAYATGNSVAFDGATSLHTVAHEAAHVIQQRAGVSLNGGVGQTGDAYEQHADTVADAVVQGKSAQGLLDGFVGQPGQGTATQRHVVQRSNSEMSALQDVSTHHITEEAKREIDDVLGVDTKNDRGESTAPDFVPEGYEKAMGVALDGYFNPRLKEALAMLEPKAPKLKMSNIRAGADVAQGLITNRFKANIYTSSLSTKDSHHRKDFKMSEHEHLKSYDEIEITDAMARSLLRHAMQVRSVGGSVNKLHHLKLTRTGDALEFQRVMDAYWKRRGDDIKTINKTWPGQHNAKTHETVVQTHLRPNENKRIAYWSRFFTLIHECMHAFTHPNYRAFVAQKGNSKILSEGVTEYFTRQIISRGVLPKMSDTSVGGLKHTVEGDAFDADAQVCPPRNSYQHEHRNVYDLLWAAGGDGNLEAAYFMGHVEYLGGEGYVAADAKMRHQFVNHGDDMTVAEIALRTGISAQAIMHHNKGLKAQTDVVTKGTQIMVPRIKWHRCIANDTPAALADQYGVSATAITRANPGITFSKGAFVLIPEDNAALME